MHFKYRFINLSISIIRLVLYGIKKVTRSNSDQKNSAATNCYPFKSNLQTFRSYKTASYTVIFMVPQSILYWHFAGHRRATYQAPTLHCTRVWNDLTVHQSCHQGGLPTTPSDKIIRIQNQEIYTVNDRCHYQWSSPTPLRAEFIIR